MNENRDHENIHFMFTSVYRLLSRCRSKNQYYHSNEIEAKIQYRKEYMIKENIAKDTNSSHKSLHDG